MRTIVRRATGLLILVAIAALTGCSGTSGVLPWSASTNPESAPHAVQSILLTVVNGTKRLAGIPTILYVCVDQPFCERHDRVLKRGTTAGNGQVTLKASFTSSQFICVGAEWVRSNETRSVTSCQNQFPTRIKLDFSKI